MVFNDNNTNTFNTLTQFFNLIFSYVNILSYKSLNFNQLYYIQYYYRQNEKKHLLKNKCEVIRLINRTAAKKKSKFHTHAIRHSHWCLAVEVSFIFDLVPFEERASVKIDL